VEAGLPGLSDPIRGANVLPLRWNLES
jgi:hypothetical protein